MLTATFGEYFRSLDASFEFKRGGASCRYRIALDLRFVHKAKSKGFRRNDAIV